MNVEKSSLPTQAEFANTSSIKEQVLDSLSASKEYRHAFIEEAIRTRIAMQIKALQDANEWDYKTFANKLNKKVSWVYRLEDPNAATPTIPTLLQVAEAFDIGLDVRFRSFSELLDDVITLGPQSFVVPSFDEEHRKGSFLPRKHRRKLSGSKRRHRPAENRLREGQEFNMISIGPQALPA